jgi:hypothetical protein
MTKGIVEPMIMFVLGLVLSTIIMSITVQNSFEYGDLFNTETVKTTGERIESGVHGLSALEEGKLEMELRGSKKYKVYTQSGQKYISYSLRLDKNTRKLENLPNTNYNINRDAGDDGVNKICLIKEEDDNVFIEGGECN